MRALLLNCYQHEACVSRFLLVLFTLFSCLGCDSRQLNAVSGSPPLDIDPPTPITGLPDPRFAPFDEATLALMARGHIPGAAVAVAENSRLVFSRGYGWADQETKVQVQPNSLFRIGSVTKTITAVAVLKLVERNKLSLDDRAVEVLRQSFSSPAAFVSAPGTDQITVMHLLTHAGGWDRRYRNDPLLRTSNREAAAVLGIPTPATALDVVWFTLQKPLDLFPGSKHAYSNVGYCILGRLIEAATGMTYEEFVQSELLHPCGITDMYIGTGPLSGRREREVTYYNGEGTVESLYGGNEAVEWPYGGFCVESLDAAAGWVATACDLVTFLCALEGGPLKPRLLGDQSLFSMFKNPGPPLWPENASYYYALGWRVKVDRDGLLWWHNGTMPGTTSVIAHSPKGLSWAVLMNCRPADWENFNIELNDRMSRAAAIVAATPKKD